jgi:uncharacterized protein HemY
MLILVLMLIAAASVVTGKMLSNHFNESYIINMIVTMYVTTLLIILAIYVIIMF